MGVVDKFVDHFGGKLIKVLSYKKRNEASMEEDDQDEDSPPAEG